MCAANISGDTQCLMLDGGGRKGGPRPKREQPGPVGICWLVGMAERSTYPTATSAGPAARCGDACPAATAPVGRRTAPPARRMRGTHGGAARLVSRTQFCHQGVCAYPSCEAPTRGRQSQPAMVKSPIMASPQSPHSLAHVHSTCCPHPDPGRCHHRSRTATPRAHRGVCDCGEECPWRTLRICRALCDLRRNLLDPWGKNIVK